MRATVVALLAAAGASLWAGCDGAPCAYGPTEIKDVALTADAGVALRESIAFAADSVGDFTSVSATDAPVGLTFTLASDSVKVGGSVAEAGTYAFQVLVQAKAGQACAKWARYDVTLTVH